MLTLLFGLVGAIIVFCIGVAIAFIVLFGVFYLALRISTYVGKVYYLFSQKENKLNDLYDKLFNSSYPKRY